MSELIKIFKGGSLSQTSLIRKKNKLFVRKKISLIENREYGFQRWSTQMKKIQLYNSQFKNCFPKILNAGVKNNFAFFDIEFYPNSKNCFEYLNTNKTINVKKIVKKILIKTKPLYKKKISTVKNNIQLYFYEEILNKIKIFKKNKFFNKFLNLKFFYMNNQKVTQIENNLSFLREIFYKNADYIYESFTHGNLTLENILICKDKIIFIDPYEENYVDTMYNDYSQILQSCNSHYELLNLTNINIMNNKIKYDYSVPTNISNFNKYFKNYLLNNFSFNEIMLIRAFEISQFVRMIPFKLVIDNNKALLFYGLSCKLFCDLVNDYRNKKKF